MDRSHHCIFSRPLSHPSLRRNVAARKQGCERGLKSRAQRTACLVAEAIKFPLSTIETDERLVEYDTGELTGAPREDSTSTQLVAAPGAEDPHAFMERVMTALRELQMAEGTVLIVAHAGVGRIIRSHKEGLDPATFYDLPAYPNASVVPL